MLQRYLEGVGEGRVGVFSFELHCVCEILRLVVWGKVCYLILKPIAGPYDHKPKELCML